MAQKFDKKNIQNMLKNIENYDSNTLTNAAKVAAEDFNDYKAASKFIEEAGNHFVESVAPKSLGKHTFNTAISPFKKAKLYASQANDKKEVQRLESKISDLEKEYKRPVDKRYLR